jgi:transcriptional regulator with XRE-family HTH domain
MPLSGWTDFPHGLRRVRIANGLTQSDLAEQLGVEQATVSRWEQGKQRPDQLTQDRIRKLLFRGRVAQDALLFHQVRSTPNGRILFSREGVILAASTAAGGKSIEGAETARFQSTASAEAWALAQEMGFFNGDVASIQFATELMGPFGTQLLIQFNWFPARMTDGTTYVLADIDLLDPARFAAMKAAGIRITLLDEIL